MTPFVCLQVLKMTFKFWRWLNFCPRFVQIQLYNVDKSTQKGYNLSFKEGTSSRPGYRVGRWRRVRRFILVLSLTGTSIYCPQSTLRTDSVVVQVSSRNMVCEVTSDIPFSTFDSFWIPQEIGYLLWGRNPVWPRIQESGPFLGNYCRLYKDLPKEVERTWVPESMFMSVSMLCTSEGLSPTSSHPQEFSVERKGVLSFDTWDRTFLFLSLENWVVLKINIIHVFLVSFSMYGWYFCTYIYVTKFSNTPFEFHSFTIKR